LPISPELAQELGLPADYGVLIMQTVRGGPAETSGLRGGNERAYLGNTPIMLGGDLIVAIDSQEINDLRDLAGMMNNHRAGDTINVTIYRGKQRREIKVRLGDARETA
jgi:S1-C subfamily serine protease